MIMIKRGPIPEADDMSSTVHPAGAAAAALPPILTPNLVQELGGYDFPFENIVFEGGGNKGLATTGTLRVLEELGYADKLRRFAGASAGAMVATLSCVGYNSHEIEEFLGCDLQKVFYDASFGILSLLPNMLKHYGWHPGKKIHKWFGKKIRAKMDKADLTFGELYKKTGKELCITVTNMNSMDCVYCHVKTRPSMIIREAVRMSACIPGVFCPVKSKFGNHVDYFVDGGLLCNYPIHCFDGWYLSGDPKDTFLQRFADFMDIHKLWDAKERFCPINDKTMGVLLYSGEEREVMKEELVQRFNDRIQQSEQLAYPTTKMAIKRKEKFLEFKELEVEHNKLSVAMGRFVRVLKDCDIDQSGSISLDEFNQAMALKNSEFTEEDKKLLFGPNYSDTPKLFDQLDTGKDGKIEFRELISFAEKQGLMVLDHFRGYSRLDIQSLKSYFGTIMECLLLNMKRIFIQSTDIKRTVGIDTGYLDTLDFEMEAGDRHYLVQQGKLGCIAFLRELIEDRRMTRN